MAKRKRTGGRGASRSRSQSLGRTSTVSLGGRRTYVSEFIEVVTVYAMRHGIQEAEAYFDVPASTIGRWVKKAQELLTEEDIATLAKRMNDNPFRETSYNIQRRMRLSDKLFAELELTVEAEKMKNGGYLPAHVVGKLAQSFSTLVDKRRLEEGAHTALVQEAKEPEQIIQEGQARVLEFKRRFGLPEGKDTSQAPRQSGLVRHGEGSEASTRE